MKLYGFPGSPNTWKVRALAHEISTPLEFTLVDLTKGEQKQPAYLAINPGGRTPTLVDGDFTLWESTAIMQYVADKAGSALWPADLRARADTVRWQCWQLQHWAKGCEPLLIENVVKSFFNLGAPDPKVVEQATQVFHREAALLDAHLASRQYLVGNALSLADFSVGAYLVHAEAAKMPLAEHKHVARWAKQLLSRPCWAATAPKI
jgi:glutathione S-transferase